MHRDIAGHDALSRPPRTSIATTTPCRMLLETGHSSGGGNGPKTAAQAATQIPSAAD